MQSIQKKEIETQHKQDSLVHQTITWFNNEKALKQKVDDALNIENTRQSNFAPHHDNTNKV